MRFLIKIVHKGVPLLLIFLIRVYQVFLSPLFPNCCRFWPSCSEYSIQSLSRFGCLRGIVLTISRLLKCHPFHPGGYDPVPPKVAITYKNSRASFHTHDPATAD